MDLHPLDKRYNVFSENPKDADGNITVRGSKLYWAIFAIMMFSTTCFIVWAYTKPRLERPFHYITASITMVAAIAYFTMASNLGSAPIGVEFIRSGVVAGLTRQIFYVRYIDWVITTPLLLMELGLTAGLPWNNILWILLLDEVMIITGLVGALVRSSYKWGYFAFGCAALLLIGWEIILPSSGNAKVIGADVHKHYIMLGLYLIILWFLYPVAWGLCEGGNVISSDSEAIFYSILDVLAKPVYGVILLVVHEKIQLDRLGLGDTIVNPSQPLLRSGPGEEHHAEVGQMGEGVERVHGMNFRTASSMRSASAKENGANGHGLA
ncbi:hypothetical protein H2199_001053 [Coniosporium tulheliwenetii]|uniref:Uncharacterized protein n=1 Tax=Coniosporium tulheliwenetii TaxID=3383036 RepID=A0ACC2ZKT5_9PEZI|nr:hypothetical protein H2199_001053 [Cladosporium sp. JES 115]